MQLAVEFFFQAAEPVVIDAHVAQHLRGELIVGVKALELLLEVDALHVEGFDGGGDLRRDAARDPGKVAAIVEARGDLGLGGERVVGIGVNQRGEGARGGLLVGDLRRDRRRWSRPARSWPARAGCGRRGCRGAEPLQRCAAAALRRARRTPGGARSGARKAASRWRRPRPERRDR